MQIIIKFSLVSTGDHYLHVQQWRSTVKFNFVIRESL